MPEMSGAKFETYAPAVLNDAGPFAPSPPNTFALLPCSSSCCANVCASGGCCVGEDTMSASLGTLVTRDEKSVGFIEEVCRIVVTPFVLRATSVESAKPTEYGSWKSISTTFFALSLSAMKFASVGDQIDPGTTRKNSDDASLFEPFVSDVRVADGEMCAIPAANRPPA